MTNIWSSLASTDGNAAGNWSLGHAPQASDDLLFNNTSVIACTFTGAVSCNSITSASNYTGVLNDGSQTITTVTSQSFDNTSNLTLSGNHIITGNGDFHIGTSIVTLTMTTCDLDLRGTGNLDVDEGLLAASKYFRNVTCSYNGKTTTNTSDSTLFINGVLTLANGGTLTVNKDITFIGTGNPIEPFITNGATINGVAGQSIIYTPLGAATITIGAMTLTTITLTINDRSATTVTYNLTGAISAGVLTFASSINSSGTCVFNTANNAVTSVGNCTIVLTSGTNTSNWTFNFGSSTVAFNTSFVCTKDTGATLAITVTSGAWSVGSTFNLVASGTAPATYNWGTSTITFTATGTTTSVGATLYNVIATAGLRTFGDAITMNSFACSGTGGISCAAACVIDKSMLHDGTGSMVFSGACTITTGISSSDVFRNTGSAGTCTMTACTLTISGNGYINLGKAVTVLNLTVAAAGKTVVNNSTATITITGASPNGVFTTSTGIFTSNGTVIVTQTTCVNPLVIGAGTWNGTGGFIVNLDGGTSWNLPAITYTGSGLFSIFTSTSFSTLTITLTGNLNLGTTSFEIYNARVVASTLTFDTSGSNYSMTCGSFIPGNNQSLSTTTFNWNASVVSITSMLPTRMAGTCNMVMGSSAWTCSGNWTWGSVWTVTLNTFTLTISGTSTIAGVTKNFYNLVLNASGSTISFATGNCTCQTLLIEPNTTVVFFAGMTYTITANTANQWDGSAGNPVRLKSTVYGTAYIMTMTAGAHTAVYVDVSDCNSGSAVTATDHCHNLGGNTNWNFSKRYWVGATSTDWADTRNWSASSGGAGSAGVPTAYDDVMFDTNSGANCVLTAAAVCCNILQDTNWTHLFDMDGFALTSTSFVTIDGKAGSAFTHEGTLTILQDGSFTINTGIATLTLINADLDLKGTGNLTINEITSTSLCFRNLTCAYNGKTTTFTAILVYYSGVLTLASGGTLISDDIVIGSGIAWCGIGICEPFVSNGASIIGVFTSLTYFPQGASTVTIGSITTTTSFGLILNGYSGADITYDLAGNLNLSGYTLYITTAVTGSITFNTNNFNITHLGSTGFKITQTTGTNTSSVELNFGCSVVYISALFITTKDVGASCTINMGSSVWSVGSDFDLSGCSSFSCGTSQITFRDTLAGTITTNGKSLYTVIVNCTHATVDKTLEGALSCNTLTVTDGDFVTNSTITTVGSQLYNAAHVLTLGGACLITGNGDFHIESTATTVTLTSASVEMRGAGNFDIDKADLTFVSVKFNADGKTISSTGSEVWTAGRLYVEPGTKVKWKDGITPIVTTYVAGDCNGEMGKLVEFESTTPGTKYGLNLPATM